MLNKAQLRKLQCQYVSYLTVIRKQRNSSNLFQSFAAHFDSVHLLVEAVCVSRCVRPTCVLVNANSSGGGMCWKLKDVLSHCRQICSHQTNNVCHRRGRWGRNAVVFCANDCQFGDPYFQLHIKRK